MQRSFRKVTVLLISLSLGFVPSAYASQSEPASDAKGAPTAKIVGGSAIDISQAPWQVALIRTSATNNKDGFFCGGSMISNQWIATAAHCVDGSTRTSDFIILAGESELSSGELSGYPVKQIIVHPFWNTATNESDIALVQLVKPLDLVLGQIETIAIPNFVPPSGTYVNISGWGSTWSNNPYTGIFYNDYGTPSQYPTSLQGASVKVANDAACDYFLGNAYKLNSMLCAGLISNDYFIVDSCFGDSGGPLAYSVDGSWYLSGIVSWGYGCSWDSPGVYANVAYYSNWISVNAIPDRYDVTYNSNGGSGGNAPTDLDSPYEYNESVTVLANTGNLVRTGHIFTGWNTSANGSGTAYAATGSGSFLIGSEPVTLYATWAVDPVYVAAQESAAKAQADAVAKAQADAAAQAAAAELAWRTLPIKNKFKPSYLAQHADLKVVSLKAKITFKVAKSSKKICTKSGSSLKTLRAGNCVLTITVQEPKPKKGKKPKATKTVKTFVVQ